MLSKPDPSHHYLRCKRDDGPECTVDLTELEEAFDRVDFLEYYFLPAIGRTVSVSMKRSLILTTRKNRKSPEIPKLYPSIVSKTGPDSSGWKNSQTPCTPSRPDFSEQKPCDAKSRSEISRTF